MLKLLKIPNQIIKGRLTPLKKVDFIVLHHMAHQGGGIADAGAQHGGHSPILRLNDADDGNILAVGHQ